MAPAEVFEHGSLHRELDQVERQEPDDVPHPDGTDLASGDAMDPGEAPVSVRSDDRRDELRNAEGTKGRVRRLMKKPCERVTKMSACEMMATWRYMIMCSRCGPLAR